jgi:hypothetical protein
MKKAGKKLLDSPTKWHGRRLNTELINIIRACPMSVGKATADDATNHNPIPVTILLCSNVTAIKHLLIRSHQF